MKAKLIINNKEFEIDISEEELEELENKLRSTGYERVDKGCDYVYISDCGELVAGNADLYNGLADSRYDIANYYSDVNVAENNARADKLMRRMRRFAAWHDRDVLKWHKLDDDKYYIVFNHNSNKLYVENNQFMQAYGTVYFDNAEAAELAIDTFQDDLMWYFTEYKDSI